MEEDVVSTDEDEVAIEEKLKKLSPLPSLSKSRSAYSALSGSAIHRPNFESLVSSSDEDSDAEFRVHPSLKGMTKTRSDYTLPRIRAKPSDFEIPVFTEPLDKHWPEPEGVEGRDRGGRLPSSPAWSSPPNFLVNSSTDDPSSSITSAACWSAPEMRNEEGEDESDFEEPEYVAAYVKGKEGRELIFASSYPLIDSTQQDMESESPAPIQRSSRLLHRRDSRENEGDRKKKEGEGEWNAPPTRLGLLSSLHDSAPNLTSFSSEHSALDDDESKQLKDREEWLERGSTMRLYNYDIDGQQMDEFRSVNDGCFRRDLSSFFAQSDMEPGDRRQSEGTRRRLPMRPDQSYMAYGNIPSSISMYERSVRDYEDDFDYRCGTAAGNGRRSEDKEGIGSRQGSIRSLREEHAKRDRERVSEDTRLPLPPLQPRPPDLPVVSHHDNSRIRPLLPMHDSFVDLKTPISPNVLSSPSGTGRRLPSIPPQLSSPTFYHPHPSMARTKQEHQLCYGMDRSAIVNAEMEEDGMNGNTTFGYEGRRKTFFSMDDSSGVSSSCNSDHSAPTHRVQSPFYPRHPDEVHLEIGDAVRLERQSDDHWCFGTNLRTGHSGIFPLAVVCEIDIIDEICQGALPSNATKVMAERDTFYLTMLASIEVGHHKGNDVLVQAMNKVLSMYKRKEEVIVPQTVLMEISFRGIHIIDKKKKNFFQCPSFDFFYSLQNISFCGAHPKQLRYFGFITKHPILPRFACHVFLSSESTQPIVESIGRAFKRSYDEYMAFAHPTEDIYLE